MNRDIDITETIPQYLARMREKDMGKHGPESLGWRTTREVADYMGKHQLPIRQELNRLWEADEIVAARDGRDCIWRARGPEGDKAGTPSLPEAVGRYLASVDAFLNMPNAPTQPFSDAYEGWMRKDKAIKIEGDEALAALRLAYAQIIPETVTGEPT